MPRACEVAGCTRPTRGHTKLSGRLCRPHLDRLVTYGQLEDWDPVPHYEAPGASPEHVAKLQELAGHGRLGAYCTAVITVDVTDRIRAMPDQELYGRLVDYRPIFRSVA